MAHRKEMRIDSFRVHFCREGGDRSFVGYIEAGDAMFIFWNLQELFEILSLNVGCDESSPLGGMAAVVATSELESLGTRTTARLP